MALIRSRIVSRSAPIMIQYVIIIYSLNIMTTRRNNPADFLKQMLGRPVEVKLNDNHTFFQGTLCCLDGTMNVLLNNAK